MLWRKQKERGKFIVWNCGNSEEVEIIFNNIINSLQAVDFSSTN